LSFSNASIGSLLYPLYEQTFALSNHRTER
jgi:hypothetical protein